jgi:hypothetical protein
MKYYIDKEILVPVGNPKKVKLIANFHKCEDCGKELFTDEDLIKVSRAIDETNDKLDTEEIHAIRIEENQVIV